jgi:CHAT domain-containing protein
MKPFQRAQQNSLLSSLKIPLCLILLGPLHSLTPAAHAVDPLNGDDLREEGRTLFDRGRFEESVLTWTQAAQLFEQEERVKEQTEALMYLAQSLYQLGQYRKAGPTLELALELAKRSNHDEYVAMILGRLGNVAFALGYSQAAKDYLAKGLDLARKLENDLLTASLLNDLGNVLASQQQYSEAVSLFTESTTLAKTNGHQVLALTALINAAWTLLLDKKYEESQKQLDLAWTQIQNLDNSHEKTPLVLNIGLAYNRLGESLQPSQPALIRRAGEAFNQTAEIAGQMNDQRMVSYGWGYLGHLYEEEGQVQQALDLTRRASQAARNGNAPDALYQWEWQTGRLLNKMGKTEDALMAYRRAMYTLQPIRREVTVGFQGRSESFRTSIGPLFFEYVDLLMKQADATPESLDQKPFLVQARATVEQFKTAELQDYFRDDCVDTARSRKANVDEIIEELSKTTAIVYPIVLPDRLELLLSYHSGTQRKLKRETVRVSSQVLTQEVRTFRRLLEKRTTKEYLPHAQQLYKWLIEPLKPHLNTSQVDTMVFVPDGALRTIPMAALHDGKEFLIKRYAVAVTPGVILTDPQPLNRVQLKLLSVGLTDAVEGFAALPHVATEVRTIQQLFGGKVLLNQQFQVGALETEMKTEPPTIVHIASHAKFEGDAKQTFLLAFDGKLNMDRLRDLIGLYQYRETPLDLITLSACETAQGDDRAALGLAGVAIKAGARSALATLWFINDKATSDLVTDFYRQLQNPTVSKAEALQLAQHKLLQHPLHKHPGYWSPFLLINNWL